MKRLDLIIDALDGVDTFGWNQQDSKLIKDALAAARELKAAVERINKENKDRKDAAWCIAYDIYGG